MRVRASNDNDAVGRSIRTARRERIVYVIGMLVIAAILLFIGASMAAVT